MIGRSIRIFLENGEPTGIRYAELVNWTGQGLAVPRSRIPELQSWDIAEKPGVYLLLGQTAEGQPGAYIGESENVRVRIAGHVAREEIDFNEVILFTSKDENLTKGHIKFLEKRMYAGAVQVGRFVLWNGCIPAEAGLPRPDREAMEEFLENLKIVLQTLGCSVFTPIATAPHTPGDGNDLILTCSDIGVEARGRLTDEGFLVFKGAGAAPRETSAMSAGYRSLREQLRNKGTLADSPSGKLEFTADYLFSSSSAAAAVISGHNRSGPQHWKNSSGKTLKEIEAEQLQSPVKVSED